MAINDGHLNDAVTDLIFDLKARLASDTSKGVPARTVAYPAGRLLLGSCAGCGGELGWTATRTYLARADGKTDLVPIKVADEWWLATDVQVVISRCTPSMDSQGNVSAEALAGAKLVESEDTAAMLRSFVCTGRAWARDRTKQRHMIVRGVSPFLDGDCQWIQGTITLLLCAVTC
jgi:hypothetical protein